MQIANPSHRIGHSLAVAVVCFVLGFGVAHMVSARDAGGEGVKTEKILVTSQSVLGEAIRYPRSGLHPRGKRAEITAQIIALKPGAETAWHTHPMPTLGYIIEGEIEVDYGANGKKTFRQGEALMEAMSYVHRGRNVSDAPVRILAVSIGEQGEPTAVRETSAPSEK